MFDSAHFRVAWQKMHLIQNIEFVMGIPNLFLKIDTKYGSVTIVTVKQRAFFKMEN